MKLDYIQMLLEFLKKKKFKEIRKIEKYQVDKVGYYDWHKLIEGKPTNLHHGIGGMDTHYQIAFSLDVEDLPKEGNPLCLRVTTSDEDMWDTSNPQFIVTINGEVVRALDMNHNYVLLPTNTDKMDVLLNVYTNTAKPDVFIETSLNYRIDPVYHLYYQIKALFETTQIAQRERQFSAKVQDILETIIQTVDLTVQNEATFTVQVKKALSAIEDWYATLETDEDAIIEYVVGHTHIDISWFWTLKQTREKVVRSFSNAVYLMERYPYMTFMSSTPLLYQMLEEEEPVVFKKVRAYIEEGRWETEGSMFVESDSNLPSGESLIRQIIMGKNYFKKKFNKENQLLWLPDCFGFSASLPQIMKKSGINYFFTSKMEWNETNRIPNDTFYWKGIDGSEVLAHFLTTSDYSEDSSVGTTYNGRLNASQVKGTWTHYQNKNLTNKVIQVYGFGDGGGGPTEEMVEYAATFQHAIPNMPKIKHSMPSVFFKDLAQDLQNKRVPKWSGELYLETHRGVLTTDGRLKKLNRETEVLLQQAEFLESILILNNKSCPSADLKEAWRNVLINQFHDVLPGTSSIAVHVEAVERYEIAQSICEEYLTQSIQILGWEEDVQGDYLLAINTTSFERDLVMNSNGKDYLIENIPAFGYKVVQLAICRTVAEKSLSSVSEDNQIIDNEHYHIELNRFGEISRLYCKVLKRNLVEAGEVFNQMVLYPDLPKEFDAWNIDAHSLSHPKIVQTEAEIELVSNTAFKTVFEIKRKINQSQMIQHIILYKHTHRIDFETKIDWNEKHVLLKVKFPTQIQIGKATYDIQFGNIERNTHTNTSWDQAKFEVCAQKWADLSEQSFGLSILNNGKYGHSIQENTLYLSLLRGSQYPAEDIDKGIHSFTYSLYPHQGTFRESDVYKEAYDLNNPILFTLVKDQESNKKESSLLKSAANNIICETIKKSEHQSDELIFRFYESEGKSTESLININFQFTHWCETNLLEEEQTELSSDIIQLSFTPYEIKTLKVKL